MPNGKKALKPEPRYDAIVAEVFRQNYKKGCDSVEFKREEMEAIAMRLGIKLPKNQGDVIYTFRHRRQLPDSIKSTAPKGYEWIILGAGVARYRFKLAKYSRIKPNPTLVQIKVPQGTPELISMYAMDDEQAILAKVRYNRLIDIFLGITSYSLQSHLRTTVAGIGQIEIDEVYVGVNRHGAHFIIPVQAKGGNDQIGSVQTMQDVAWCKQKYPNVMCRAIAAQFLSEDGIAMFELTVEGEEIKVVEEKHYRMVPRKEITDEDLAKYRTFSE